MFHAIPAVKLCLICRKCCTGGEEAEEETHSEDPGILSGSRGIDTPQEEGTTWTCSFVCNVNQRVGSLKRILSQLRLIPLSQTYVLRLYCDFEDYPLMSFLFVIGQSIEEQFKSCFSIRSANYGIVLFQI